MLENELNSSFQTHLFDLLNEQEELYEFYNYDNMENSVLVRNCDLPLTDSLENLSHVVKEFKTEDKQCLAKLRWYASDAYEK